MGSQDGKKMYAVGLDTSEFNRQASEISSRFRQMDSQAVSSGNDIEKAFKRASMTVGGLLSAVAAKQFINQVIRVRGEFQQLGIAFETMLGSKQKADKLMQEAVAFSAKTPFTLTDVASNIKQLMAMGIATEDVMDTIKSLGDVAAGVSVPISRIAMNYGQVAAAGKLQGREMRDFAMAGIPLADELAKNLGKAKNEISGMIEAGKIGFKDVEKAFQTMSSEGGKFYNLMEKQNASVTGQISNLKDKIDVMLNSIGQANEGIIYEGIAGTAKIVANYEAIGKILAGMVITYGAYKTAVIAVNVVLKEQAAVNAMIAASNGIFNAGLARQWLWTERVQKAQALLNKTMLTNPYVLVATAVVAVGAAIWAFGNRTTAAEKAQKRLNEELEKAKQNKEELKNASTELTTIIDSETSTIYQQIKAYEELQKKFPELYKNMSLAQFKNLPVPERQRMESATLDNRDLRDTEQAYESARQKIVSLNKQMEIMSQSAQSGAGFVFLAKQIKEAEAYATLLKERLDKIHATRKQAEFEALPTEDKVAIYNKELDTLKKQREEIETTLLGIEETNGEWAKFSPQTIINVGKLQEVNNKIDEVANKIASLSGGQKPPVENKAYWEAEREKAQESLDAMAANEKGTKQWNEALEKLNKAKEKLKIWDYTSEIKNEQERLSAIRELKEKELAIRLEQSNAIISLMKEGFEKQNALAKQQYSERLADLDKQEKDYLDKLNESKGYKPGDKDYITSLDDYVKTNASDTTSAAFIKSLNELKLAANLDYFQKLGEIDRDRFDSEKQSMNEYLKEFGTYQQKRLAITNEYADRIAKAQTKGERLILKSQRDKELKNLDFDQFKDSDLWAKMFGDLDKIATSTLKSILNQAKAVNTAVWDTRDVKEYQEAIDNLENEIRDRNPFEALKDSWGNLMKAIKTSDEDLLSKSAKEVEDAVTRITGSLETIGNDLSQILGENAAYAAENITTLVSAFGDLTNAAAKFASGDIIGGITETVKAIRKIVTIAKQVREMNKAAREEMQKFYDEAIRGEMEYQMMLRERLRIGQQIGEITLAYHKRISAELQKQEQQNKSAYDQKMKELQEGQYIMDSTYTHGTWFRKAKTEYTYGSLAGKTYEDLEKLYTEGRMNEKTAKMFEDLQKLKGEGVDIDQMLVDSARNFQEALSGLNFDSLRDSFKGFMDDGKVEAGETANYMEKVFKDAIVNSLLVKKFDAKLQGLTDEILKATEDGILTPDKLQEFKDKAKVIGDEMNAALSVYDGLFEEKAYSQEASRKGFETMSQDVATELNGRFTALQMHGASIAEMSKLIQSDVASIKAINTITAENMREMRDISLTGIDYLSKITKNTNELYAIKDFLADIKKNTDSL